MVIVFDAENGEPAAFLLDGGYLTSVRTGAAGGVAAKYLAPEKVWNVAVIGTGDQARYQLDALAIVRPGFTHVSVWGRHPDRAATLVAELPNRPGTARGLRLRGRALGRRGRARRRRRHHVHRQPVGVGARGMAEARRARHGRRIGRSGQAGARPQPPRPRRPAGRRQPHAVRRDRRAPPRARRRTDRRDEGGRARRDLREAPTPVGPRRASSPCATSRASACRTSPRRTS